MNAIATSSIGSESNDAIDAVRVEYPPVAIVVIEWLIASNTPIPAIAYESAAADESPR